MIMILLNAGRSIPSCAQPARVADALVIAVLKLRVEFYIINGLCPERCWTACEWHRKL